LDGDVRPVLVVVFQRIAQLKEQKKKNAAVIKDR